MKKILLIEPLSPIGHRDINKVMIKLLNDNFDITYISMNDYINLDEFNNIEFMGVNNKLFIQKGKITTRINYYLVLRDIFKKVKNKKYDLVLLMSYETITLSMFFLIHKKTAKYFKQIFLLNHLNIDETIQSKVKKWFFNKIPNKAVHLCYEDFITKYVQNELGKKSATIKHNLNYYKKENLEHGVESDILNFVNHANKLIVSPSNNKINMEILEMIISLDKEGILKTNNLQFVIKSNAIKYKSENLLIDNIFFTDYEYNSLIKQAQLVFLPYNVNNYSYRVSGVFYDCITFGKPVLCSEMEFFRDVFKKYGDVGFMYNSVGQLETFIRDFIYINEKKYMEPIQKIQNAYSDKNVENNVINTLTKMN